MPKIQELKSIYKEKDTNIKLRRCKECYKIHKVLKMENSFTCKVCYVFKYHKKRCCKCKMVKNTSLFSVNSNARDGFTSKCKDCINIKTHKKYHESYYKENKEKLKAKQRQYRDKRMQVDPLFKVKANTRALISNTFKRKKIQKNTKSGRIIGCSWDTLYSHLNKTCINNYGYSIENLSLKYSIYIDYIVPISTAKSEKEVIKLNDYKNLQILIREDSSKKNQMTIFKPSSVQI